MHWIAASEKETNSAALEKRLWDTGSKREARSPRCKVQSALSHRANPRQHVAGDNFCIVRHTRAQELRLAGPTENAAAPRFEFHEQSPFNVTGGTGEQDEFVCGHAAEALAEKPRANKS